RGDSSDRRRRRHFAVGSLIEDRGLEEKGSGDPNQKYADERNGQDRADPADNNEELGDAIRSANGPRGSSTPRSAGKVRTSGHRRPNRQRIDNSSWSVIAANIAAGISSGDQSYSVASMPTEPRTFSAIRPPTGRYPSLETAA